VIAKDISPRKCCISIESKRSAWIETDLIASQLKDVVERIERSVTGSHKEVLAVVV
jgi:hypothetical protein